MLRSFTRAELLSEWLTRRGYQPLRADVATDITAGTDLAAHLGREVADWINHIYATAPAEMLPVTEGSDSTSLLFADTPRGAARISLPPDAARIVSVRLSGWDYPVALSPRDCPEALAALNPFMTPDCGKPLAVMEPDGRITLWPATTTSRLDSLLYIPHPSEGDGPVTFDPLLLTTINTYPD